MSEPKKTSQADELLKLADAAGYWFGTSTCGEPFGVPEGGSITRPLRGGRGSVRVELARAFAEQHGKAPSANALADTMLALEGRAYVGEERELNLRLARRDGTVWLDLGATSGDLVKITADGWKIVLGGGPLFRRTRLTGRLPKPSRGGSLAELRELLRIGDNLWPLVEAWLVCILLLPGQPVPVLGLTGEQGTAKSWQSRLLVLLVDPSDSPLRTAPRDVESWAVAAAASRVVALDNVSRIEPWLSDCLCRAVTGDGLVRRALYSDSDVSVISFRRVVLINGISLGGLRGDLADRLVRVRLDQLTDAERLDEADLAARWDKAHPAALGGLLDLTAAVLARLPDVRLDRRPRMADYARVLAAVDQVRGTSGLEYYLGQRRQLAAEVVEDEPVATAIADLAARREGPWEGTAAELLELLRPADAAEHWPANGRGMTARIDRVAPALRDTGTSITEVKADKAKHEPNRWRITREETTGGHPQPPDVPVGDESTGQGATAAGDVEGMFPGKSVGSSPDIPRVPAGEDVGDVGDVPWLPLHSRQCAALGCEQPTRDRGDGTYGQRRAVMMGATWPEDTIGEAAQ